MFIFRIPVPPKTGTLEYFLKSSFLDFILFCKLLNGNSQKIIFTISFKLLTKNIKNIYMI